jgi:spectinomycin phosphotransferase
VDLDVPELEDAVAAGWGVRATSTEYVPEGGGSHHWKFLDHNGTAHVVTVDDLDDKDWLGDDRATVFEGLARALGTSAVLRNDAALDFVVAPIAAASGEIHTRVTERYAASVFPYLTGTSHPFGPYRDPALRERAIAMVAALHAATASVEGIAPRHTIGFTGRRDLEQFLDDPAARWDTGPFSERARHSFTEHAAGLAGLLGGFHALVERTSLARAAAVVTHGEPHPANLMTVDGNVLLIDWDTTALGPPERDLWLIVSERSDIEQYERATGRQVDPAVLVLYRLRWFLDDLGSAVRLFRNPHLESVDTRRWIEALEPGLAQIDGWVDELAVDLR